MEEPSENMQNSQTQFKVTLPTLSSPTSRQAGPPNKQMEPKFAHKNASGAIEVDTSNMLRENNETGDEGNHSPMSGGMGGTQLVF
jgi:hypothetical protein